MNHIQMGINEGVALEKSDFERWMESLEKICGHNMDGDQQRDGYSIDRCLDLYNTGFTPEEAKAALPQ